MRALGLNAPFGAQCFLTGRHAIDVHGMVEVGLNAPFGAQCFLTQLYESIRVSCERVLMHLLALSAF